jgi:hypothetical protein
MTQWILLLIALTTVTMAAISFYWNDRVTKFIVLAMFVLLANSVYFSLDGVKGWPAEEPSEVKGMLASVVVVNPTRTDPGGIYISLFPTLPQKWYEYVYPREAPKTYFVEYSNNRAEKFEMAKEAMENGKEVLINGIPPKEAGPEGNDQNQGILGTATGYLGDIANRVFTKEKDTYTPSIDDIQILEDDVPPDKGSD